MLFCCWRSFLKRNFFEKTCWEYHGQSAKQFWSSSGTIFCRAWSESKLFTRVTVIMCFVHLIFTAQWWLSFRTFTLPFILCFGWEIRKLFFWYTLLTKGLFYWYWILIPSERSRTLVMSAYQKNNFLISKPKHTLWVLKRTVSMRRFFWAPNTYVETDG